MDYYLELIVRPDPEFTVPLLLNSFYNKLHALLVEKEELNIGVSFPDYDEQTKQLGAKVRLYGAQDALNIVRRQVHQSGFQDYFEISEIEVVPKTSDYIAVRRVQVKSSPTRLARRYALRHSITLEEALLKYQAMNPKKLSLPYLVLNSQSTNQQFRLFVKQTVAKEGRILGNFNRYGFSKEATLPRF